MENQWQRDQDRRAKAQAQAAGEAEHRLMHGDRDDLAPAAEDDLVEAELDTETLALADGDGEDSYVDEDHTGPLWFLRRGLGHQRAPAVRADTPVRAAPTIRMLKDHDDIDHEVLDDMTSDTEDAGATTDDEHHTHSHKSSGVVDDVDDDASANLAEK